MKLVIESILRSTDPIVAALKISHRVGIDGKSAFMLWKEEPGNENKTISQ